MIFSKMSKNSAADCPRLYVRSSQQLREFKVSNELLTHRVVISLSCSSHIVTFAIHTFDLHKILCLCCFVPLLELDAKIRRIYRMGKKLLSLRLSSFFLFSCQEHSAPNLHISSTSPLAILYTLDDFSSE